MAKFGQIAAMSVALSHRFSVDDYYGMVESGILKPDAKVELIEGEIIDMLPAGIGHNGPLGGLTTLFGSLAKDRWVTHSQGPLRIDEYSEPEPDLLLLRPPWKRYTKAHPIPGDVFLLIEVSDSSLVYDRTKKLALYARAGIADFWIVNISQRQIEIYREPTYLGYESKQIVKDGHVAPAAFPDAKIDVTELLH